MALLQKFGNNGLHFSRSPMLTKKATIFLDDGAIPENIDLSPGTSKPVKMKHLPSENFHNGYRAIIWNSPQNQNSVKCKFKPNKNTS